LEVLDMADEVCAVGEGAEEACKRGLGWEGEGEEWMLGLTDVEMVSVLFWRELAAFFDHAVPAIVSAVLVDFLCRHVGDSGRDGNQLG
jgi:hypothetical protein